MATQLRHLILGGLFATLFVLPAAATASASPEEDLRARAQAYWEARAAHSEEAASFYPPGEEVKNKGNIAYREPVVETVEVDGDKAIIRVRAMVQFPTPPSFAGRMGPDDARQLFSERWELVDGVWYKTPVRGGLGRLHSAPKKPIPTASPSGENTPADEASSAGDAQPPASDTGAIR